MLCQPFVPLSLYPRMPNIMIAGLFLARDVYGAQMGLGGSSTVGLYKLNPESTHLA
jgi:hypothetical protein